jgi:hypothetical protein
MQTSVQRKLEYFCWFWVVVFVLIGVLGAGLHVLDYFTRIADNPALASILVKDIYGQEFFNHWLAFREHQVSRLLHMVVGIVFVVLIPLQMVPRIRERHPQFHKMSGYAMLIMSLILVATGCIFAFQYTYTGLPEQVPTVTFSLLYLWVLYMAISSIRAKRVDLHREWMIRAFSMMMGISATRVWFYIFLKTTDIPSHQFFSSIFWLGLGVNLIIAEIWINLTRLRQARPLQLQAQAA